MSKRLLAFTFLALLLAPAAVFLVRETGSSALASPIEPEAAASIPEPPEVKRSPGVGPRSAEPETADPFRSAVRVPSADGPADPDGPAQWAALLARLRKLAPREDYHLEASSVVGEIAALVDAHPALFATLAAKARHPDEENERVRAGLLVAAGELGDPDLEASVEALLGEFRGLHEGQGELERAAWLAWARRATGAAGVGVPVAGFPSNHHLLKASMPVWPLVLERVVDDEFRVAARARTSRPMSPEFHVAPPLPPELVEPLVDDLYTREIVTIAAFGTSAGQPGGARDQLLDLAFTGAYPEIRARDAALWCLARVAQRDDALAAVLGKRIASLMATRDGAELLRHLVSEAGRGDLALAPLRELLSTPTTDLDTLNLVYGVSVLLDLFLSEDEGLRSAAQDIAVDSLLDPGMDEMSRLLLMLQLRTGAPAVLVDAARVLFATETDPTTIDHLVNQVRLLPREEAAHLRDDLIQLWDHPATDDTRRQVLRALGRIGDDTSLGFLRTVAATTTSEDLRQLIADLLEEDV